MSCYKCHSFPCQCHRHNHCNDDCSGCLTNTKGNCVFYTGSNLDCLGVTKGDNLSEILVNLNSLVCDLVPPSGIFTTLTTCNSGDISLAITTPSGIPNYRICLNPNIRTQLDANTNNILVLDQCIEDGVLDIISDSIDVSVSHTENCGRTLRLEVISPSGLPTYAGLVIDDTTGYSPNGLGGNQVVYTKTFDFNNSSAITTEDRIIYVFSGQYTYNSAISSPSADIVDIKFFNGATQKFHLVSTAPSSDVVTKSGYHVEWILTIKDATVVTNATIQVSAFWYTNLIENGALATNSTTISQSIFNALVTGIDLTALKTTVTYTNNSLLGSSYNILKLVSAEVTKKI